MKSWMAGVCLVFSMTSSSADVVKVITQPPSIIHMGNLSDPGTLNPFQISTADSAFIVDNLYEGLVVMKNDSVIAPGQAESWRMEDEGRRYVFQLRKNLKWSNGEPLTAHDFVAGFRYQADPRYAFFKAEALKHIQLKNIGAVLAGRLPPEQLGVSAPDNYTVVIELEQTQDTALVMFSNMMPLYQPALKKFGQNWASRFEQLVVNGPYEVKEWFLNERIVLSKNPNYWNASAVAIDEAVLHHLTVDSELKHYQAGALDMTNTVVPGRYEWMKKHFGAQLRVTLKSGSYFYILNHRKPQLKDPKLRRALSYSIDRKVITEKVLGYGLVAARWFAPVASMEGPVRFAEMDNQTEALNAFPLTAMSQKQREQEARRLFKEAGYGPENPLELEILYNTLDVHRQVALAVTDMWKRNLAVTVKLRNTEWNLLDSEARKGTFDVLRMGWLMKSGHPCFQYAMFHSEFASNYAGYKNAAFDKAYQQACHDSSREKRAEGVLMAEQILEQDMPVIPIYNYADVRLVRERVKGYPRAGQYNWFRISDLWLEDIPGKAASK